MFLAPYTLMLHNTSHRKLFRPEWTCSTSTSRRCSGRFSAQSPGTYYAHHVGMHHPENNLEPTSARRCITSATRSSTSSATTGASCVRGARADRYFRRNNRAEAAPARCFVGEVASSRSSSRSAVRELAGDAGGASSCRCLVVRFLMMAGNWGQHAFIDAERARELLSQQHHLHRLPLQPPLLQRRLPHRPPPEGHAALDRDAGRLRETRQQYVDEGAIVFRKDRLLPGVAVSDAQALRVAGRRFVALDGERVVKGRNHLAFEDPHPGDPQVGWSLAMTPEGGARPKQRFVHRACPIDLSPLPPLKWFRRRRCWPR